MDHPSFYAIIPASVRYDKRLKPNAKLLYGEITALCSKEGFCWADNNYFGLLYEVDHKTISRWISSLENAGYLMVEHFQDKGNTRKIYIDTMVQSLLTKKSLPSDKKVTTLVIKKSLPSDKIVTPIYESITISNTMIREQTAIAFLEVNHPSDYERLMMQYKSKINDWIDFSEMFEAKVLQEGLEFKRNVIEGRFVIFARNWIKNQKKFDPQVIELNPGPKQKIKCF
jgi:hypothetical protein